MINLEINHSSQKALNKQSQRKALKDKNGTMILKFKMTIFGINKNNLNNKIVTKMTDQ